MTEAFLQMPLTQMVDLVINSPEEGVVNFNLLHAVLHVIVKEINAQDISVELQGANAQRLQNILKSDTPAGPSLNVTVVGKKDASTGAEKKDKKDTGTETVYIVQPTESSQNCGMTVTKKQLNEINQEIDCIKEKLQELTDLPGNMGIIDAVRTETSSPVFDMFQILSLTKRIDAAEIGMNKLASIVEDLIKNPAYADRGTCTKAQKGDSGKDKSQPQADTQVSFDTGDREALNGMSPNDAIAFLMDELNSLKDILGPILCSTDEDRMSMDELFSIVSQVKDKFFKNKKTGDSVAGGGTEDAEAGEQTDAQGDAIELPPDVQLALLEERFADYTRHIENMDRTFNDELSKLHSQFTDIEKDFNEILLKIQGGLPAGDSDSTQCCASVYQKIAKLQADFDTLTEASSKLIEDKDEKTQKMDLMLEQIELLKTIKADKEDVEEALAEKADACAILRKVSHAQFDNACDELTKGIEDALAKLAQQEELWQHALEDIQNEIGTKLDKMDLGPLREFINNKLRQLQDKMRSLAALKKEQEAAGTKSKLLRDVNCISCDKDVVMRKEMDPSLKPPAYSVPPSRSMAPYLAYELDALRKQQKGGGKNMNNIEAAFASKGGKKPEDHICNRYCGGSHTVTTPQQRVTRLGHFLLQWGPEGIPKEETPEKAEKEVQTRTQSVTVSGDILSARRSGVNVTESTALRQSASKVRGSRVSVARGSVSARMSGVDEKRASQMKQSSQQSVRSTRSAKKTSKVMEEIVEAPTEEGAPSEVPEPPTESESLAPPPTRMDEPPEGEAGAEAPPAEDQGQAQPQEGGEAAPEAPPAAEEAAPPPAEAEAPPTEEE